MSATANVNVFLPGGTYWLVWALAGTLIDGPWIPPVTINGQATTGNGLQLCTCSGWGPALDGGSNTQQAFPFVIDGTVAGGGGGGATSASLSVSVNTSTLRAGNRLVISATLAGSGPTRYDAYVLIDIPGGGVVLGDAGRPGPRRGALRPGHLRRADERSAAQSGDCPPCRSAPTAYAPT